MQKPRLVRQDKYHELCNKQNMSIRLTGLYFIGKSENIQGQL